MAQAPTQQVDVPTREEFDALTNRVAKLESDVVALDTRVDFLEDPEAPPDQPPETEQPPDTQPPPSGNAVKAWRVADFVSLFGVNTFSSMDENNIWGSWPADYRPEEVIKAIQYMTGDSGHTFRVREYHYSGREAFQQPWIAAIQQGLPGTKFAMCVGANGSSGDVASMLTMQNMIEWFEGLNEPNTNFGSGEVPTVVTMDIQEALWAAESSRTKMGPSVVAGMPHPEGWITGYFGDQMDNVNALMHWGNGHYYPPHCPDLTGDGTSLAEYIGGLWSAYAQHNIALTEFHPTLYNSEGKKPGENGWSGERDAYYMLLALLRAAKCTVEGLWWYALFDYGTVYTCGLFPKNASDPRPAATALKTLCSTCPDKEDDRHTFDTASLDLIMDIPSNCDYLLTQASRGTFYLFVWHSENEPGGMPIKANVSLPYQMNVSVVDLLSGQKSDLGGTSSVRLDLPATVNVLVLTP